MVLGAVAALAVVGTVYAAVGQPRTAGPNYDRNPSVVQDGALTYLFFARSSTPCNRIVDSPGGIPCPDTLKYDLYFKVSPDGGKTFGPDMLAAANAATANPSFYGRTIAATRITSGPNAGLYVFWASGGNSTTLYYVKMTGVNTFTPPAPVLSAPSVVLTDVFNVEAVGLGPDVYLYTEECCAAPGVYARRWDGAFIAAGPNVVSLGKNIPKAIVDNQAGPFKFRMTFVDASLYPTVNVWVASSPDGLTWPDQRSIVQQPGISNWDPSLVQKPNGNYELYFAPSDSATPERQRIAATKSNDFVRWSAPHDVTPSQHGGTRYWDYWPEGFVRDNQVVLFYTSERGVRRTPEGTGHIWTDPGFGGLD